MSEKAFLVDSTKCIGCGACQVACKEWNNLPAEKRLLPEGEDYSRSKDLTAITWSRVFYSKPEGEPSYNWTMVHQKCNHCAKPNCLYSCPEKAIYRHNGWVIVDHHKCIGCGSCVNSCIYGAINISKKNYGDNIEKGKAYKCHGCVVKNKKDVPFCASQCPTNALVYDYRLKLIKMARERVKDLKKRFPQAYVYGINKFSGLNVITILKYKLNEYMTHSNYRDINQYSRDNQLYYMTSKLLPPIKSLKRGLYRIIKAISTKEIT